MFQCGEYTLSPEFIASSYKKVDARDAEIMWDLIQDPARATLSMVQALVFTSTSVDSRSRLRYFFPTHSRINSSAFKTAMDDYHINATNSDESIDADSKPSAIYAIKQILKRRKVTTATLSTDLPQDDFLPFSTPSHEERSDCDDEEQLCPHDVETALYIASQARRLSSTTFNSHYAKVHPARTAVFGASIGIDDDGFETVCHS